MERRFLLVDVSVLPEVFLKVLKAKELLAAGNAKNVSAATKMAGLSRSAFYKYKDCIFDAENSKEVLTVNATLLDETGALQSLLAGISAAGASIVTINQATPENGAAQVASGWNAMSVPSVKSMPCPTHGCGWMPKPCAPNAKLSGWTKNVRSRPNWFHTAILTDGNMTRGSALSAVRRRNDKERKDG